MVKGPVAHRKKEVHRGDWLFAQFIQAGAMLLIALLLALAWFLIKGGWPAIERYGARFLFSSNWNPVLEVFGAAPVIYGTLVSSAIAIMIAAPLSVSVALFLHAVAPPKIRAVFSFFVDMLAAIPSVVYGLWGIFVLAPWLRSDVEPWLSEHFGFLPFFQGPFYGVGMLAAGLILAIMIIPSIFAMCSEVFRSLPVTYKEAALALGATRWEMMQIAFLRAGKRGIIGGIILGLGRALGETMAVTMLIGNRDEISVSLFSPGQTMASVIANEYAEAGSSIHVAALIEVGLVLFCMTILVNALARIIIRSDDAI